MKTIKATSQQSLEVSHGKATLGDSSRGRLGHAAIEAESHRHDEAKRGSGYPGSHAKVCQGLMVD